MNRAIGLPMRFVWLAVAVSGCLLSAAPQDPEFNVNTRYTVEAVTVSGDGWSTDVAAEHPGADPNERISSGLRRQITALIGTKLNPAALDQLANKLRKELQARTVTHRVLRGATPEYVRVAFEVELRPTRFDVSVPKFLYSSSQGWSGALEGTATVRHNGFTAGLVSDGDELTERYTGVIARYENTSLNSDRVRFRFQFASYHEQWSAASRDTAEADSLGLYRTHQDLEPVVTFVLARPLTVSMGASFERLQEESPGTPTEAANALISRIAYQRRADDSDYPQEVHADYSLRAGTRLLGSDFVYGRHRWTVRYAVSHGKHTLSDELSAGMLTGRAPLFERFVLGNSTTLRGWNKYDIDPVGGNRMVHNSVEYRYGCFQAFYDSGAIWDAGQTAVMRHSLGMGLRQGPLFVAIAFPVRDGRLDPILMVGMNY